VFVTGNVSAARAGSVKIGDRSVYRLGLGTNRVIDSEPARAVLRRAVELGVDLIDTADVYQSGASESTIGETLSEGARTAVVATKGGMIRTSDGLGTDGRPEQLRSAVEASLRRLGIHRIELYQFHRPDPNVPLETSVGTLRELQEAGKIHHLGLCNVTVEEIERARQVATIVSVQNQYNVLEREHEPVLEYCDRHSIVFMPYTPLLRGNFPRAKALGEMASRRGVTPSQLALRWLLQRSPMVLPIPGTLSVAHLEENLAAADIELSDEEFHELGR
jgi:pyridoxine 4-dehydrogenase